jgi:hypothetical protein
MLMQADKTRAARAAPIIGLLFFRFPGEGSSGRSFIIEEWLD